MAAGARRAAPRTRLLFWEPRSRAQAALALDGLKARVIAEHGAAFPTRRVHGHLTPIKVGATLARGEGTVAVVEVGGGSCTPLDFIDEAN